MSAAQSPPEHALDPGCWPETPAIEAAELEVGFAGGATRGEQEALFARCFKKPLGAGELAWRYDRNPHGRALGLLLRTREGECVASFMYMPRIALAFGDESTAVPIGQQGDIMTHPDWRRRGLGGDLSRIACAETARAGWPMNWGFPNRMSASVFAKLGWRTAGLIRPWTFFLSADAEARRERFREGRVPALLLPIHRRRCRRGRRRVEREGRGVVVAPVERFDDGVRELCAGVERTVPFAIRRDARYLDWRFHEAPSGLHRAFAVRAGSSWNGYVVVQLPRPGESVGYLVDLVAEAPEVRAALLAAAIDRLEEAGCRYLRATAVDGSAWARELETTGFLPPKPENHLFVYTCVQDAAHPLMQHVEDASRWFLTDGDRDDETMG